MTASLIQRDLTHIWHPCSYMDDFKKFPPLVIERAQGSYLYTQQGPVIDAISSWWCKSLGHGHPAVVAAIEAQLHSFEHVIGANTTHPLIVKLAEHLTALSGKQHVFFASDGSCAVEIALKLAIQAAQIRNEPQRTHVLALQNGYHGETLGTLSVSDLGLYKRPFQHFNLPCHMIDTIPYVTSSTDPLWQDCSPYWPQIEAQLAPFKDNACALIFEPIIQGAGGMKCYSADFLQRLVQWARQHNICVIADEIMTGLGRTGRWFACDHANISPDIMCLSKGLTSGSVPLSCVLVEHEIYALFAQDYQHSQQAFLHSHTYSGNALAVSAALATLEVMQQENIPEQAQALGQAMQEKFQHIADETGKITNVRGIGAVIAGDLAPHASLSRVGFALSQVALAHGALLRPIGNTLYWLPPLTMSLNTLDTLATITQEAIKEVYAV